MNRSFTTVGRLAGALAVVGAVAGLAAGSASADPTNHSRYSDTRAKAGLAHEPEIIGGIASPAPKYGPLDPWAYALVHRSTAAGMADATGSVPPDVRDHRLIGRLVQADRLTAQSGFDWGDAAIGAGTTLGLMLLGGGMALVARRRHATPSRAPAH